MTATIFAAKVIGNAALGIWAGYNVSISHVPSTAASPCNALKCIAQPLAWFGIRLSRPQQQRATAKSRNLSTTELLKRAVSSLHISAMSALTLLPNLLAFSLANRSGKHPYLVYVALGAQLVGALQFFGAREIISQVKAQSQPPTDDSSDSEVKSDLSSSTYEHVSSTSSSSSEFSTPLSNHEFSTQDKYGVFSTVCASLSCFLFVVSTVGLAGDAGYA